MLELKGTIQATLEKVANEVYHLKASSKATYPYLVFSFEVYPQATEDELQLVTLQVDGWHSKNNDTTLDMIMKSVEGELKNKLIQNDNLSIRFKVDSKIPVFDDKNSELRRRTYLFTGRLYERNDN